MSSIPTIGQIITHLESNLFQRGFTFSDEHKEEGGKMSHIQTPSQDISYLFSKRVLFVV